MANEVQPRRRDCINLMQTKHNKQLVPTAKMLRKNMTKEERLLWYGFLRNYPVKFLRQKVIGNYIVDFYCAQAKLVIELDGSQHFNEENIIYDKTRTAFLEEYGLKVFRIQNLDLNKNLKAVCETINEVVKNALIKNNPSGS